MTDERIGLIGAGQMGRALARGLVAAGVSSADRIAAFDPAPPATEALREALPEAVICPDVGRLLEFADVVLLAVKPQHLPALLTEVGRNEASRDKLFISIVTGFSLAALSEGLGHQRVIRVMPNTPCLVGCGASAYALGAGVSEADAGLAARLLSAVGSAWELPESALDAVTGLSGSGPAYVYLMIEALSDGGVRMGLPRAVATALAAQTLLGAARMVQETGNHPGELKDQVASPGGTTITALQLLERRGLRAALIDAVEAATLRSVELGSR
jgi:pyrroline-5-carboxylate reductase